MTIDMPTVAQRSPRRLSGGAAAFDGRSTGALSTPIEEGEVEFMRSIAPRSFSLPVTAF